MSTLELTMKIKELKELKNMADELSAEIKAIEDIIKCHMGESELLIAGEYKVRWTRVTSNRFDSTSFKKAAPEIYAQYLKPTTSRRFSIA